MTKLSILSIYGNTGCPVFKWGVQNWKDFCLKINRKLLNFENLCNGEVSKNDNNKKCAPKLILFNEKKIEKDSDDF